MLLLSPTGDGPAPVSDDSSVALPGGASVPVGVTAPLRAASSAVVPQDATALPAHERALLEQALLE
eukprot:3110299-Prymnesium_polylepis.1